MRQHRLPSLRTAVVLALMFTGMAAALSQAPGQDKKAGRPSEPAKIQEVQEVNPEEVTSPPTLLELIGKMHPALVHLPIGWLVLLLIVEVVATATGSKEWARAGFILLPGVLVSMLPAIATGLLRASAMANDPDIREFVGWHRNLNLVAGLICLSALAVRYYWRESLTAGKRRIYVLLLTGATLLVLLAGHLGGKMVFGKDYLPF